MSATYHVTIKKDYAEALLIDLEKMGAIELVRIDSGEISEWRKDKAGAAKNDAKENL